MSSASAFPTLQLLIALVESRAPSPIHISHAVWFSSSGDVEGHFYIPEKRGGGGGLLASGALHFSVCWPPSNHAPAERGEDRITRRRRQRRSVFEVFTALSMQSSSDVANDINDKSSSTITQPRVACDVVAVLVHPNTASPTGDCALDYLDAQRLQQFCDLPPPTAAAPLDDTLDSQKIMSLSKNQEALLIKFPSTVVPHYKLSVAYLSCHAHNGTIASELRQSKHPLVTPAVDSSTASQSSFSKARGIGGGGGHASPTASASPTESLPGAAVPLAKRTNANCPVAIPSGFGRRLSEIGGVCARAFPSEWWGNISSASSVAARPQSLHRFFLNQRLSMFFLVEYSTQVHHVMRFTLLCVTSAPRVPPPSAQLAPPPALSPIGGGDVDNDGDMTPEDISWTVPAATSGAKLSPTRERSPSPEDKAPRWTFVKTNKGSSKRSASDERGRSGSGFAGGVSAEAHLKSVAEAADRRLRAASPGGFLVPSLSDRAQGPQGRYEHHRDGANRQVLSNGLRPAWQVYNQQRFDDDVVDDSASSRRARQHISAADHLQQVRKPLEHEIESVEYLTGQRDGSLFGYLVDGRCPIARLDNLKVAAPANKALVSLGEGHEQSVIANVSSTTDAHEPTPSAASLPAQCISSQTLKILQTTDRNDVPTRTADPFLRVRRGLIPAIERRGHPSETSKHKQQPPKVASVMGSNDHHGGSPLLTTPTVALELSHTPTLTHRTDTSHATKLSRKHQLLPQRRTFLDRFVEAVTKVEIARGHDAIGNPLTLGSADGSSSAGSSPQGKDDQGGGGGGAHRRPAPLAVAFGGLTPGTGANGLGGSVNTPWTPWRTTPMLGGRDLAGASIRGEVFVADTPRTAFKRLLYLEPIVQAFDDFFYAIYSLHGGSGGGGDEGGSANVTSRQQQQQLGITATTSIPLVVHVSPEAALEAVFWASVHLRIDSVAVTARRKISAQTSSNNTVATTDGNVEPIISADGADATTPTTMGEPPIPTTSSPSSTTPSPSPRAVVVASEMECTVTLQVVNDYATLAKVKHSFERLADQLSTRIDTNPLPLTESLRERIRNRKTLCCVTLADVFDEQLRRTKDIAAAPQQQPPQASTAGPQRTKPTKASGGGEAASDAHDAVASLLRCGVDVTQLFQSSLQSCSVNGWMTSKAM